MAPPETLDTQASRRIDDHPILGQLDTSRTFTITVDGQDLTALAGEPIAATLLAHGIIVCRTSPDSGEPRGPFCAVGRCPDCLMTVDGELNVRTCVSPVRDGMRVQTQARLGEWEGGGQ